MQIFTRFFAPYRLWRSPRAKKIRATIKHVLFGKYLILTNSLTCGTLMFCGDGIQQKIEKYWGRKKNIVGVTHDWARSRRMFIVGLIEGPPQHVFYGTLDWYIPSRNLDKIAIKILLDQLVASPMCLLIFFFGMGLQEGRTVGEIATSFKEKFMMIYTVDCCVWPPSQFINFYFIRPKYRVVYISFITMLYNCFLSFVHHASILDDGDRENKDLSEDLSEDLSVDLSVDLSEDEVSVEEDDAETEKK